MNQGLHQKLTATQCMRKPQLQKVIPYSELFKFMLWLVCVGKAYTLATIRFHNSLAISMDGTRTEAEGNQHASHIPVENEKSVWFVRYISNA